MDEMKTNPPVQNSPAEPPKKVRRVGTMAFAVLLIAGGVLLLAQQFMPKANLLAVLKFAPVILIVQMCIRDSRYPGRNTGTHDCKYYAGRGTRGIV